VDAQLRHALACEDAQAIAGARCEFVGGVAVEVDLARSEFRQRDGVTVDADLTEATASLSGSLAKSVTRGSFCRVVASCTATVSTIAGAMPRRGPRDS
jgi:hypothetical protein